ncbi:MAG: toll/interleukin-1 receptor domain-containing protein [Calothrix sp. MO_167.B12]|nr:toll/interleukin-1 receptor domain-containing protein [Calothrix sp. MO_167.B12]
MSTDNFDVFLAHNSLDKPQVEVINEELKQRGLKPWLDKEQIPPGRWFQDVIQKAIPNVKSAAIFIGVKGLGKWQALELRSFISLCVEADIPVIPVLLPGVDNIPENLLFLQELHWVRFFEGVDEVDALNNLIWGITGEKPR